MSTVLSSTRNRVIALLLAFFAVFSLNVGVQTVQASPANATGTVLYIESGSGRVTLLRDNGTISYVYGTGTYTKVNKVLIPAGSTVRICGYYVRNSNPRGGMWYDPGVGGNCAYKNFGPNFV